MNTFNSIKSSISYSLLCMALLFTSSSAIMAQSIAQVTPDPYMTFETPLIDFGVVKKGEVKKHVYKFTNTGKEDITIEFVSVGCECTELEAPEGETFKPGESGEITAIYYSEREEELGEHDKYFEIMLTNVDPKTGNPIIREANFKVNVVE